MKKENPSRFEKEMIEIFEVYDLILSPDCPVFLYFMFDNQQSFVWPRNHKLIFFGIIR